MHCVDRGESFQTHIFLQNLASIQPRASLVKFARSKKTPRGGLQLEAVAVAGQEVDLRHVPDEGVVQHAPGQHDGPEDLRVEQRFAAAIEGLAD